MSRTPRARSLALAAAACLAVAGCGGDDEQKTAGSASTPAGGTTSPAPDPKQDIQDFAKLLDTALTTPRCDGLDTKVNKPEEGGISIVCPADDPKVGRAVAGYETIGAEAYGSGAVIDYTAEEAPQGGTWELSLGSDGTWVIDAGSITRAETVGTELEDREAFQSVLERFLDAVRRDDCDGFFKYAVTASQDKPVACKDELPVYDALATALKADPEAKPFFMGGNARYAFFGLKTDKPKPAYRTATVVKSAEGADQPYLVARTKLGPNP